ncbi:MAG: 16S rRNA (guanine(966)-N(2))-methyltransferase RsmD [Gammaproteobacteria bacterium]|nr:MAG: 16S rRNA (guanine(966)-N(2))-methyltransferase RsmD [Gammaproteobacteria bacterium]UCH39845.1 MAG: 16S rRNA (guanine(966)-N(2))-methyltransferase RsmD [Gammaproteobacteria bacterium]
MAASRKSRIRIIGGKWRGRKLDVIDSEGLRPTPDRIRETLFNWLAPYCPGALVLDCFAGSGALGLEALSRGARGLVALEQQPAALASLRELAEKLAPDAIEVIAGDALTSIASLDKKFDLVFIDPPYARPELRQQLWRQLESRDCLKPGARVYFEWPVSEDFKLPSAQLHWVKQKSAGQVNYAIAEWQVSR